ncbi:hypothetical protein J1N35_004320 [Gossypium stocksii]|uniref:RNase H type-1 domain-containing protein n=1 Tax=Gossypium stocksii TaxID=47602 RepID=A0A9D4AI51_9ROSI|nr:hypothetical protein J1N35_004320 [Gossypium stocksii]
MLHDEEISWACLFGLLARCLWKNKKLFIFQRKSRSSSEIIKVSMCWAKQFSLATRDGSIDNIVLPHEELLPRDWTFLNTNGAIQVTSGRVAAGRVVRDGTGDWGILDGLKLIQRRGHSNVVIHSDSLEIVKAIHGNVLKISSSALIRRIHRILSKESHWTLRYIPKEENQCVDYLAKLAFERNEDLQLVETPPDAVLDFFKSDKERNFCTSRIFHVI